ncbi:hypothetical protein HY490_01875 [Candidatus Woesearchaeota archaeon]|nr:hypothetical protein [Candidatus Woesearchaeota archaeon]
MTDKQRTVMRETPLEHITLRRYEKPFRLEGRPLVKKFCLSVGVLQPGDSRDVVVDVLHTLLKNHRLTASEIETAVKEERKKHILPMLGVTSANIRRQLRRLQQLHLIDRTTGSYHFTEKLTLSEVLNEKTLKVLLGSIVERVQEYAKRIDENFPNSDASRPHSGKFRDKPEET